MKPHLAAALALVVTFGSPSDSVAQLVSNPVHFYSPLNGSGYTVRAGTATQHTVPIDVDLYLYNPPFIPNYMQVFLYKYIAPTNTVYTIPTTAFAQGTLVPLTSTTVDASGTTHFRYQANLPVALNQQGSNFYFSVSFYDSFGNRYVVNPDPSWNQTIFQPSGYFSLNVATTNSGPSPYAEPASQPAFNARRRGKAGRGATTGR